MKWTARSIVRVVETSPQPGQPECKWNRWFAWYPVTIATGEDFAQWVWLEFVERRWSASRYGNRNVRRYRLALKWRVKRRLRNIAELTQKLDAILARSDKPHIADLEPSERRWIVAAIIIFGIVLMGVGVCCLGMDRLG